MLLFIKSSLTILTKEILQEFRTRFVINTVLAFVFASLFVVLFSVKAEELSPTPRAGLIWIIIIFAALTSLARIYVQETDRNTLDLLRLHSSASIVFIGKWLYNSLFLFPVAILTCFLYILMLDITIQSWPILMLTFFLGAMGMSSVSTFMALIVSQANRRGTLFSVITLPLLVPLIVLLVKLTKVAFIEGDFNLITQELMALIGYNGVMFTISILLADFIWED